jgi:[ribosomal protein S5]-alanine N-acetyltransferase
MSPGPPPSIHLKTAHLLLRPTVTADADRAFEIQSDWDIARMLAMAAFPPDRAEIKRWFAEHSQEWFAGSAYRFAATREGKLIGVVDIASVSHGEGAFGCWFDRAVWGRGTPQRPPGPSRNYLKLSQLRADMRLTTRLPPVCYGSWGFSPSTKFKCGRDQEAEAIIEYRYQLKRSPSDRTQ